MKLKTLKVFQMNHHLERKLLGGTTKTERKTTWETPITDPYVGSKNLEEENMNSSNY